MPYLGENPYITASLDIIYGIQTGIANLFEIFVFPPGQLKKYDLKNTAEICLNAPKSSKDQKLSLYDGVFSYSLSYDARMGSFIS